MSSKFARRLIKVLTGVSVLFLALLLFSLDTVDYEPYFRAEYYQRTSAELRSSLATNKVARGSLSAGFGKAILTPDIKQTPLPLAGYGDRRGRYATGVHDDLYVKAVALKVQETTGIIISADALIIPREVADMAAEQLRNTAGVHRDQIYFSATHTHCSFGGWGEGLVAEAFAGKYQPEARRWFAECIVRAATIALADTKPASLGHGSFEAPEFVRNRLLRGGQTDPEFAYIIIKQTSGASVVLGSYAAHSTTLSSSMMEFSGDYSGFWQRAVERETGGMAVFLAGGMGSHSPNVSEKGLKGAELLGETLAVKTVERLKETLVTNTVAFGRTSANVTMPEFHVRVTDGLRLRPWLAARLVTEPRNSILQVFRLDGSIWVSTPCDFSGELALVVKDSLRARGFQGAVTSFNGDYVGYVIPARYYHMSGYEPRIMSFYGPNVPDYFSELISTMARQLMVN